MEAGERARRDANLKKKRSVTSFPLFSILFFFFPARMMCSTAAAAADARFTDTHCAMSSLSTQQNCQSLEASLPHHHFIPSSSAAVAIFTLCRPLLLPALLIEGTTALPLCFPCLGAEPVNFEGFLLSFNLSLPLPRSLGTRVGHTVVVAVVRCT